MYVGGRDWNGAAPNERCVESVKLEEAREDPPLGPPEGIWPCRHLNF